MFSGIVEECARVTGIVKEQENVHFTLQCSFVDELKIDQSVAHNGVCLTVVRIQDGCYTVTAMKETLDRSNLGLLKVGDEVNVERSMMMNGISCRGTWTVRPSVCRLRMPKAVMSILSAMLLMPGW